MDAALRAKDRAELSGLFTDLPDEPPHRGPVQVIWERLTRLSKAARGRGPGRASDARDGYHSALADQGQADPAFGVPHRVAVGYQPPVPPPQPMYLPRQLDRRFSIGRAPSCDFTVSDISVSRWHARLHLEDEHWLLSDLGSTNGTRVNGWRVTAAVPVRPGDQLSFGNVVFVLLDNPAEREQSDAADYRPAGAD